MIADKHKFVCDSQAKIDSYGKFSRWYIHGLLFVHLPGLWDFSMSKAEEKPRCQQELQQQN